MSVGTLNVEDSHYLMGLFDKIIKEIGLDRQNYECYECTKAIGTLFGPAKICIYTKMYYCDECHTDQTSVIPAKVVFGWDFTRFQVCDKAKSFLDAIYIEPIVDIKSFHASLFALAPDVTEVVTLRKKLHYMNIYLTTCREQGPKERLKRLLLGRGYLHDQTEMYSIKDLEEIHAGFLLKLLRQAVRVCEEHIFSCVLCSGKGFICEVCRVDQPVYPFQMESISQCQMCFTVFHADCSLRLSSCPKCDRVEARGLNWHVANSKMIREEHVF